MKKEKQNKKNYRVIDSRYIAGLQFYDYAPGMFPEGDQNLALDLYAEPTNMHDPKAIVIKYKGVKLGHVPRPTNELLYAEKAAGGKVTAWLVRHDKSARLWERLAVQYRTDRIEMLEKF